MLLIADSIVNMLVVVSCVVIAASVVDSFMWSGTVDTSVCADSIDEMLGFTVVKASAVDVFDSRGSATIAGTCS